jgi:tRNA A-37 threonylcarbamoyl transferase component Bud32
LRRSYLLTEEIHGGIDLGTFLRAGREPGPVLIQQAARLIARLHDEGFSHRDLKESNLIIGSDDRVYVIDLDGLKYVKKLSNHRLVSDLERLLRGVNRHPVVTRRHRVLFLFGYCRARKLRKIPRAD